MNVYVLNPNPEFTPPPHHGPRPKFIKKLANFARTRQVTKWSGFYSLLPLNPRTLERINRQRHFNKHRARAIQAVAECAAHHLNIVTGIVQVSVEKMSQLCGLTTKSKAGNISITRCSRAVLALEEYGVFRCEKIWDRVLGMWIPKRIEVTDFFIDMCGVKREEWEAAQNQQLGYQKRGLAIHEQEQLTLSEAKRRGREQHRKVAFERRRKQHEISKARRLAIKLKSEDLQQQKSTILNKIIKSRTTDELVELGPDGLDKLINKELNYLLKIAEDPPLH